MESFHISAMDTMVSLLKFRVKPGFRLKAVRDHKYFSKSALNSILFIDEKAWYRQT